MYILYERIWSDGRRQTCVCIYMFMVWKKLTRIEDDDDGDEEDDEMAYLFQAWGNWQRLVGVVGSGKA